MASPIKAPYGAGDKFCKGCKRTLPRTSEFWGVDKKMPDGLFYRCKDCNNAYSRNRVKNMTPEERKAHNKRINSKRDAERAARMALPKQPKVHGPTKGCPCCKRELPRTREFFSPSKTQGGGFASYCKECTRSKAAERRLENLEEARARDRAYYASDPDRARKQQQKFNATDKGKANQKRAKTRRKEKYGIHDKVATAIRRMIGSGNGSSKWTQHLGYTVEELERHLVRQFTKGMTLEKLRNGEVTIDHIVPIREFPNAKTIDHPDLIACWDLSNLRPMWPRENSRKGGKRIYLI